MTKRVFDENVKQPFNLEDDKLRHFFYKTWFFLFAASKGDSHFSFSIPSSIFDTDCKATYKQTALMNILFTIYWFCIFFYSTRCRVWTPLRLIVCSTNCYHGYKFHSGEKGLKTVSDRVKHFSVWLHRYLGIFWHRTTTALLLNLGSFRKNRMAKTHL